MTVPTLDLSVLPEFGLRTDEHAGGALGLTMDAAIPLLAAVIVAIIVMAVMRLGLRNSGGGVRMVICCLAAIVCLALGSVPVWYGWSGENHESGRTAITATDGSEHEIVTHQYGQGPWLTVHTRAGTVRGDRYIQREWQVDRESVTAAGLPSLLALLTVALFWLRIAR